MSLHITCPACQAKYLVNDDSRGKKLRCRGCDTLILIPESSSRSRSHAVMDRKPSVPPPSARSAQRRRHDEDEDDDDDRRPRRRRQSTKRGVSPLVMVLVGGGLTVVVLLVVCGIIVFRTFNVSKEATLTTVAPPPGMQDGGFVPNPNFGVGADLPVAIDDAIIAKVKAATVLLRVRMHGGGSGEGSGFFAGEPGYITTNAHVLGMLTADARRPKQIDVYVNSGEANEMKLQGTVVAVDRDSDLAVVRVDGEHSKLPEPLPIASATKLKELQRVYVFGFPFGTQAGRNISVRNSTVTSLKKNADGMITLIQLDSGIDSGNSGGPVVDADGVVVGVSVAEIRGTSIDFAVAGDRAQALFCGRYRESEYGEPYRDGNGIKLNVAVHCLDPFNRIKEVKVDVWSGPDGSDLRTSTTQPPARASDSPKRTYTLAYNNQIATADIAVPSLQPGKMYWIQPVVTDGNGVRRWMGVKPYAPTNTAPLERQPVVLEMKYNERERTLSLSNSFQVKRVKTDNEALLAATFKGTVLEVTEPDKLGRGISTRLTPGQCSFEIHVDGDTTRLDADAMQLARKLTPSFLSDANGRLRERGDPNLKLASKTALQAKLMYDLLTNAYEATSLTMPNRLIKPQESWRATVPMLFVSEKGREKEVLDMNLKFVYEGQRRLAGRNEAYIRLSGNIQGRGMKKDIAGGFVDGYALFDLDKGFVSEVQFTAHSDFDNGLALGVSTNEVTMKRVAGNTNNIMPIIPAGPNANVAKGRILLDVKGDLSKEGQPDLRNRGKFGRLYMLPLESGKRYIIEMSKEGGDVDPLVRVQNRNGQELASDDDSGGQLNARLIFTAPQTDTFGIIATHFGGNRDGNYRLIVSEAQ